MNSAAGRAPTSADVARLARVSRSTVSLVVNDVPNSRIAPSTRERVLAAVRELGYAPNVSARQLRAGTSRLVVMPLPELPLGPIIDATIEHLSDKLRADGLTLLVHGDRGTTGMAAARMWAELHPAAVLVTADRCTKSSVALLRRAGTEVLMISSGPTPWADTLEFDQGRIGAEAAAHLLAVGHRRLAAIIPAGPLEGLGRARAEGLENAARAAGARGEEITMEATHESAASAAATVRRPGGPTAVFTYNDEYGALLHRALNDQGATIPGDVALVGADNLAIATFLRPMLSSVALDPVEIADHLCVAVRSVLERPARTESVVAGVLATPFLVRRETS
ncbi:LacI family transcriptional regulator [Streptomyces sp. NBC_01387]|uniref:LacI family DNA-binding transcriptional regulator n=1 Tax=unclassified Streptomyces TaxID=2593676 RepID=UPI0020246C49|nr:MULTISPECIES: LacI family DNA-binding transcriptional regulator [unclassified Streptomyces]MCX4552731.1 LacI family transcriptional regulator [Streptomyces sp. NBC_01500]WSC24069.1 LacI family transcriptional regulator [Streptomyces sp. NBC_01766]WSV57955.1 LacI family transcriptional regulator [Streptomyces sp. NBC_01014]